MKAAITQARYAVEQQRAHRLARFTILRAITQLQKFKSDLVTHQSWPENTAWTRAFEVILTGIASLPDNVKNKASKYVSTLSTKLMEVATKQIELTRHEVFVAVDDIPDITDGYSNVVKVAEIAADADVEESVKAANEAIPEGLHRLAANLFNILSYEQDASENAAQQDASKNAAQQAILAAADEATCAKQATLAAEEVKDRFLWARNMAINANNANLVDQRYNNVCKHFGYSARSPAWLGGFIQQALARIKMLKDRGGALPLHRHAAMYALTCVILWHNKRTKKQASEWLRDFLRNTTSIDQQANPEWPSLDIQASIDEAKKEYDSTFTVKVESYKLLPLIRVALAP